jgi:transposase, IS5 family
MWGQAGFFDIDDRLRRLSDLGDQLEAFRVVLDFEIFRPELDAALAYSDGARGGRPPFDPVMMFKILVIQATNNLSDERAEFLINDRLSFMRFLGLGLSDRIPDARTIWLFREKLTNAGAIGPLFERFDATLRQSGYIAMSGQIVDASLIAAPRQRNSEDEKKAIKEGRIPDDWKDKPAKLRQKDRDARWTVKFTKAKPREDGSLPTVDLAIPVFGYQNHISIDCGFGFIRQWSATDAAAVSVRGFSTKPIRRAAYGRIPPTDRRPAKSSWERTASSAMSIAKSQRGAPCPARSGAPTMRNRKSAPRLSMFPPNRRTGWACSSAPSASPGQK